MMRALVIEDELIVAMELESRLVELGLTVVGLASSHREAMALAASSPPDLVLADVRIAGGVSGIETAAELRELYGAAVIVVSAHSNAATRDEATAAGAMGFLVKPFDPLELSRQIQRIEAILNGRSRPSDS